MTTKEAEEIRTDVDEVLQGITDKPQEPQKASDPRDQEIADLKRLVAKLENDKKAISTSRMRQEERDQLLVDTRDDLGALREQVVALVKSQAAQDEELAQDISGIEQRSALSKSKRSLDARYNSLKQSFIDAISDEDGKLILEWDDPALTPAISVFNEGTHDGQTPDARITLWSDAVALAHKASRNKERANARAMLEKERVTVKAKLDKAGVYDLDTGPATGSTGAKSMEQLLGPEERKKVQTMGWKELNERKEKLLAGLKAKSK